MTKLCIFVGSTVLSSLGWSLGAVFGIWAAFGLSGLGAFAGIYLGWKFAQRFE
ncbi:MAG: hypothetical protein PHE83_17370 [Opitutaceae bacterium]|nr:hypothetical protein [Opitutaceae bacterium]